jgi:hypothetical protein
MNLSFIMKMEKISLQNKVVRSKDDIYFLKEK